MRNFKFVVVIGYRKFEFDCPMEAFDFAYTAAQSIKGNDDDVEIQFKRVEDGEARED